MWPLSTFYPRKYVTTFNPKYLMVLENDFIGTCEKNFQVQNIKQLIRNLNEGKIGSLTSFFLCF